MDGLIAYTVASWASSLIIIRLAAAAWLPGNRYYNWESSNNLECSSKRGNPAG
jgi:hypothetical protein